MKESTAKLVAALEAENSPRLKRMIKQAKEGYYHEYDSNHNFPLIALVMDLVAYGFPNLAERVKEGEFDASREEIEMWASSLDGMEAYHDEEVIARTKVAAKAFHEAYGLPWSDEHWDEFIKSNQLST